MTVSKQLAREATTAWLLVRHNPRPFVLLGVTMICLLLVAVTQVPHADNFTFSISSLSDHKKQPQQQQRAHAGADNDEGASSELLKDSQLGGDTIKVPLGKTTYDDVTVSDCLSRLPANAGRTFEAHVKGAQVSFAGWTSNDTFDHSTIALRTHEAVRIMSKFHRAATLLDVGANIGKVTFPVMAMGATHTVIAVEPVQKNVNTLCMTANLNGWLGRPGLLLLQAGMSDKDGKMQIYVPEGREDNASLNREAATANVGEHENGEEVRLLVGDDVIEQGQYTPDLIKIDTQGHEIHVLRGLKKYLRKARSGSVLVMAESDPKLMRMSGVEPVQVYELMVEDLGYSAYCKPTIDVVDEDITVTGTALTKEEYPPGGCRDIFYFKQPQ